MRANGCTGGVNVLFPYAAMSVKKPLTRLTYGNAFKKKKKTLPKPDALL